MIRWKGLILLAVVFGIALTVTLIFKDSWLERRIEEAGSAIVGARVDIDDLDLSLTGLHIRWNRLQVTDPRNTMQNLIETGRCEFNMETWPLLSGKVIIENLQMSDLQTGTPREEDGKLPEPPRTEEPAEPGFLSRQMDQLSRQVSSNVSLNVSALSQKVNVDSIMTMLDLRSLRKIDSLQNNFEQQYQAWDAQLTTLNPVDELRDIESDLRSLSIDQINSIPAFKEAISTAEQSRDRVRELYTTLQSAGDSLVNDLKRIPSGIDRIDDWVRQDYQRAQARARLPDISGQNISRFIFGDRIVNQFTKYMQYVGMAREYAGKLQSEKPEKKKPPRMRGQDIPFFNKNARPRFWIQQVSLSGTTANQIPLEGTVTDIVSEQRFIGRPTEIDLASRKQDGIAFSLHGTLNYMEDEPREEFELNYANFSLKNANLSGSALLPNAVSEGTGAISSSLHLRGDSLKSTIRLQADQLQFAMNQDRAPGNQVERLIQSMVESIHYLEFMAVISGARDDLTMSLTSNLDQIYEQNLKSTVMREIERARQEIRSQIDQRVETYRSRLTNLINEKEQQLQTEIDRYEQMAQEQLALLEQKRDDLETELQARVQAELDRQKSRLKEEALDQLKNLIK